MTKIDPLLMDAMAARQDGRNEEALRLLTALFDRICRGDVRERAHQFMTMFQWELLAHDYAPARDALVAVRDQQSRKLLDGDNCFYKDSDGWPRSRFRLIVGMNDFLGDASATYALFVQLRSTLPEIARSESFVALPAIVDAGDFALAEQYMPDPLSELDSLNALARELPLFPPAPAAPRLTAELSNLMKDVRLRAAILTGLGRAAEAEALRTAALAGIDSEEMRLLAQRESAVPGTIIREASDRSMALEGA